MAGHREPRPLELDRLNFAAANWDAIRAQAEALHTDGCSGPTIQVYVNCCYQHDIAYCTHSDEFGFPITRQEADERFRECIQHFSPFGEGSPMAAWRYWALRLFGWRAWRQQTAPTYWKEGLYERLAELQAARVGDTDTLATPEVVAEAAPQAGAGTPEASGVDPDR